MKISFYGTDGDELTSFDTEATFENGILEYIDKTNGDTLVRFEIKENHVIMNRTGCVIMNMEFIPNKITECYYSCDKIEFNFKILCTDIFISKEKFSIDYKMLIDEDYTNEHKLWILFH